MSGKKALFVTDTVELLWEHHKRVVSNLRAAIADGEQYACPHCGKPLRGNDIASLLLLEPDGNEVAVVGIHQKCKAAFSSQARGRTH